MWAVLCVVCMVFRTILPHYSISHYFACLEPELIPSCVCVFIAFSSTFWARKRNANYTIGFHHINNSEFISMHLAIFHGVVLSLHAAYCSWEHLKWNEIHKMPETNCTHGKLIMPNISSATNVAFSLNAQTALSETKGEKTTRRLEFILLIMNPSDKCAATAKLIHVKKLKAHYSCSFVRW